MIGSIRTPRCGVGRRCCARMALSPLRDLDQKRTAKERAAKIKMRLKYPGRALEQRIFERDGYTCVYCGGGVASRRLLLTRRTS